MPLCDAAESVSPGEYQILIDGGPGVNVKSLPGAYRYRILGELHIAPCCYDRRRNSADCRVLVASGQSFNVDQGFTSEAPQYQHPRVRR
jgi:hypothetical protein